MWSSSSHSSRGARLVKYGSPQQTDLSLYCHFEQIQDIKPSGRASAPDETEVNILLSAQDNHRVSKRIELKF